MNPSQKADQGRQGEIDEILTKYRESVIEFTKGVYTPEAQTQEWANRMITKPKDEAKAALNRLITSEAVRIAQESLTRLTENGHGGGNFRRLIILEEKRLAELVKGGADNV